MIGVFDSGVGGLGVLAHIRREMPDTDVIYLADQARAPYGTKSLDDVAEASHQVTAWLIEHGAETIVVACNTASAAALELLRGTHTDISFVGMEPAVKPAAYQTASGTIGVLATEATFQGELFSSVVRRHASGTTVITAACPEWVGLVESGETRGPVALARVEERVGPMLDRGADCLVLGCTHFPFLAPVIREIAGPDVAIIDPAPAVARQVRRVHGQAGGNGSLTIITSGPPGEFATQVRDIIGIEPGGTVLALSGHGDSHLFRQRSHQRTPA